MIHNDIFFFFLVSTFCVRKWGKKIKSDTKLDTEWLNISSHYENVMRSLKEVSHLISGQPETLSLCSGFTTLYSSTAIFRRLCWRNLIGYKTGSGSHCPVSWRWIDRLPVGQSDMSQIVVLIAGAGGSWWMLIWYSIKLYRWGNTSCTHSHIGTSHTISDRSTVMLMLPGGETDGRMVLMGKLTIWPEKMDKHHSWICVFSCDWKYLSFELIFAIYGGQS